MLGLAESLEDAQGFAGLSARGLAFRQQRAARRSDLLTPAGKGLAPRGSPAPAGNRYLGRSRPVSAGKSEGLLQPACVLVVGNARASLLSEFSGGHSSPYSTLSQNSRAGLKDFSCYFKPLTFSLSSALLLFFQMPTPLRQVPVAVCRNRPEDEIGSGVCGLAFSSGSRVGLTGLSPKEQLWGKGQTAAQGPP